ncbi:MAG: hypothetical protein ACR2KV_07965 [Solirubrobacteraceae bacterium]
MHLTERDLAEKLHALGLRKRVAKNVAHTAAGLEEKLPASARGVIKDMLAKIEDAGPPSAAKRRKAADDK